MHGACLLSVPTQLCTWLTVTSNRSDLLTQIHKDLAKGIGAIHNDVRQIHNDLLGFMGVLVPDLKTALDQKDELQIHLLPVPPEIEQCLEGIFCDHPGLRHNEYQYPPLRDMADAFVVSLELSTKSFKPGLTRLEKTPPVDKYINLLICLFLLKKLEESKALQKAPERSHWPSYIEELKEACCCYSSALLVLTNRRGSPTNATSSLAACINQILC